MPIKNIILDFGGVLLSLNYKLTEQAFINLGCKNFSAIYSQAQQTTLFNDFEIGKISETIFFDRLKNVSGLINTSEKDLRSAWDAMLIAFPADKYVMLKELKKNYRLFLLSNTNETHITAFEKLIAKTCSVNEFENLFEKVYYSCRMGLRKPNANCFLAVLEENNLSLNETVFIDDSIQHINGALAVGLQSHFLPSNTSTQNLLQQLGFI